MLRMHDHLKYPYFVAFYENRVKVGLSVKEKRDLLRLCQDEIGYLTVFIYWKQKGRPAALGEFFRLLAQRPWLLKQRKVLGQFRRLLFFQERKVAELRNV
mgnify:CR=1 FL=1